MPNSTSSSASASMPWCTEHASPGDFSSTGAAARSANRLPAPPGAAPPQRPDRGAIACRNLLERRGGRHLLEARGASGVACLVVENCFVVVGLSRRLASTGGSMLCACAPAASQQLKLAHPGNAALRESLAHGVAADRSAPDRRAALADRRPRGKREELKSSEAASVCRCRVIPTPTGGRGSGAATEDRSPAHPGRWARRSGLAGATVTSMMRIRYSSSPRRMKRESRRSAPRPRRIRSRR